MSVTKADLESSLAELSRTVVDPRVGLYGPGSVNWNIAREAILFVGGGRAALLQTAHPFIAYGVDQFSATKTDPLGRFRRTFDNVFAMVFGDLNHALRSARRVHLVHSKIHGEIPEDAGRFPAGSRFDANDEEALFWVHASLVETALQVYDLLVRPLSYAEKDAYYQESRRFAALFGIPASVQPPDFHAFQAYCEAMWDSDTLVVTKPALDMRRFLFSSPKASFVPAFRWIKTMTAGLMPARLREAYRLPWSAADRAAFKASVLALRTSYPRLPARLRYQPAYVEATYRLAGREEPDRFGRTLERWVLSGIDRRPRRAA
ncbi:MAG: DUF2236 domain-containing protein [Polyangiaceae bacterium]|nr:DUF2236 domain-containing protein [Polyangiaceae bacterium]MCW5788839.1 DUF2236 domain-containing protein [Polyangiaceae bacterium]